MNIISNKLPIHLFKTVIFFTSFILINATTYILYYIFYKRKI